MKDSLVLTMNTRTTRLAPSPTGALHLGNVRTFMINWALARQGGHRLLLRIEDLDGPRIKPDAARLAIDDLRWLGIDWDGDVLYQRQDLSAYQDAVTQLRKQGLIYPCSCTRKDLRAALSAPHEQNHELRYPGTCRPRLSGSPALRQSNEGSDRQAESGGEAWRLIVPDETVRFDDRFCGPQEGNVHRQVGDFVIATKAGLPAYQLAVVVDDARQGVTDVIRGDDLLRSTLRQLWLFRYLGLEPPRHYVHVPLVMGPDGRRLAKRHGDTRLAWYRERGVDCQRVVGLIARWCGVLESLKPVSPHDFLERFSLDRLPTDPVVFTQEDHEWLVR